MFIIVVDILREVEVTYLASQKAGDFRADNVFSLECDMVMRSCF
jgi:hypothetical protein